MLSHGKAVGDYSTPKGRTLYYHSGGRYWRKALLSQLSSHYKPVTVSPSAAPTIYALLNSQLFYWYWISNSNCMDVVSREVLRLPMFVIGSLNPPEFEKLMNRLIKAHDSSRSTRVRHGERINTKEVNFDVSQAKSVLDEIDCVLAKHYGFTDDQLDFIINYDIKYRMGQGAEAEDAE